MSDLIDLQRRVAKVNVSPQFENYSKVILHVSDDISYEVGNDTGRALEITNPFGTQAMAENILASLTGYQYQPYTASGAILDPAAEIGDAVNIRGAYGGIYKRDRLYSSLMRADISAPQDEDIDHEYKYESSVERQFKRSIDSVKASLIIANGRIDASVTRTGGSEESFGWSLQSDAHRWYANGQEVVAITASGLFVKGHVEADEGKIGNFNISATAIWNNLSSFGGSQTNGVYIGTDGLQLGQAFKVDTSGNVTATRLTVDTLYIGGTAVSAATLNSRANSAYTSISSGGYCYNGATYGLNYNKATVNGTGSYPSYFTCGRLNARSGITMQGYDLGTTVINYKDHNGNNRTLRVVSVQ